MNSHLDPDPASELASLRAEVDTLRRDLDRALARLDLPNSQDRREGDSEWANMEFKQVNVRHSRMQIPLLLYSGQDESGIYLYDSQRRVRGRFAIDTDGQARLEILNAAGKVAVSIGEEKEGRGELRANDADGATRAGIKAGPLGGALSVANPQGKTLAAVMSNDLGGQVFVCTPGLRVAATLRAAADGGALILTEPGGQTMGSFVVTSSGAALTVHGEHGAPAVSAYGLGVLGGTLILHNLDGEATALLPWDAPPR